MVFVEAGKEYKTMILRLDRIKNFLFDQKVNYESLKYIHIAGTNGKGSTAKVISEILINSGYKVGLYTSPHLIKINERIQINSLPVSDRSLNLLDKKYSNISKKYNLTFFEYITALAFIYFVRKKADVVVLETGLGGRLDATNIVTPIISVITSIDFDHTEILGKTLKQIAFEKAGIIKRNVPIVCGNIKDFALKEIKKVANKNNSQLYCFGKDFIAKHIKYDWKNLTQQIKYYGLKRELKIDFKLLGLAQVYNFAVILCVCEILSETLNKINFDNIKNVLKNIKWPARFDVRKLTINNKKYSFIIDGAHNMQAIENFLDLYKNSPFNKKKTNLIFTMMQEKNYKRIIKEVSKIYSDIKLVNIDNNRALDLKILKKEFSGHKSIKNIAVYDNVEQIFSSIRDNDIYICLGSFYLAGKILKYIEDKNV